MSAIKQSILTNKLLTFLPNNKSPCKTRTFNGADNRNRTGDLILTKDVLYHLSHISNELLSNAYLLYKINFILSI